MNHINIHDAHIFPDPAGHIIFPVDITAQEWTTNPNNNPLINAYVNAAPHDIFFSEDLFTSDGDEDGFNVNSIASGVRFGGVRIGINHSAEYGVTHNATECHGISFGPPGPMQLVTIGGKGVRFRYGAEVGVLQRYALIIQAVGCSVITEC